MALIKEDNVSNVIILSTMLIVTILTLIMGYFFTNKQYADMEKEIITTKEKMIEFKKENLKKEVEYIEHFINFNQNKLTKIDEISLQDLQEKTKDWISSINFEKNAYIYVYEIKKNMQKEEFLEIIASSNKSKILMNDIDSQMNSLDEKLIKKIMEMNEVFLIDGKMEFKNINLADNKISYIKYLKSWNWIIFADIYLFDTKVFIEQKKDSLKIKAQKDITSTILMFFLFLVIANSFGIFLGKQIELFFENYRKEKNEQTKVLQDLNQTLEKRVNEAIDKSRRQEQILIQKSKFVALGEMVSNIAHQWRQPLTQLSAILIVLKFKFLAGKLEEKDIQKKSEQAERLIEYMSRTIDDFRNFFSSDKQKSEFSVKESITRVLNIAGSSLTYSGIKVNLDMPKDVIIFGFQHLYEQVVLNIITNAKDCFAEMNIKDPEIKIKLFLENDISVLSIQDNGGGIKSKDIEKVFEPYYTTKSFSKGTGIGLYMSKTIIEDHMSGRLIAENTNDGAKFSIKIKNKREESHPLSKFSKGV